LRQLKRKSSISKSQQVSISIENCFLILHFQYASDFWESIELPAARQERKKEQIESIINIAVDFLPLNGSCVEFCAGGGYVGLAIAALRPDCIVYLTDMNSISLKFAERRAVKMSLQNVKFAHFELSTLLNHSFIGVNKSNVVSKLDWLDRFDIGVALHACGSATDAIQKLCMSKNAAFVVSPCCYGFVQQLTEQNKSSSSSGTIQTVIFFYFLKPISCHLRF
jgi:hypothetical protein